MSDYRKIRAVTWRSWLDGLPDEIYDKSSTSHIVRLMDALCGDNGVGYLRKRVLLRRLQTSLYETRYADLDTVYSQLFALPRLTSEEYSARQDALLLWGEINDMDIKDAHYRKRIWDYMLSFQYGGTLDGLSLAAQAATGLPCRAIDGCLYYRTLGVDDSEQGNVSYEPINYDKTIDFNGVTILVMTDEPLSAELMKNLSDITNRLRPPDVHYTFMTRRELMDALCFTDIDDDYIEPLSVESSSDWWRVVRMVTGRPDWGLDTYGNNWIEANVAHEAPQQLLVNSQEAEYDFTPMVKSITASTEHTGRYNTMQREFFESFNVPGADMTKSARNALSQASSRIVASGYYGDMLVIDGAYPSAYTSQLTDFFIESGRGSRFWSSEERGLEHMEWVELELKRMLPVNHVSFCIFRKPVLVKLYMSSYIDNDGNRVWVQAKNRLGLPLSYRYPEWGGTANGEQIQIEFEPEVMLADAIRVEFHRLDVPHYSLIAQDTYQIDKFNFSVECANLSVKYMVKSVDDFREMAYEDMFGNRVDTSLEIMSADRAIDEDCESFWMSQPNVGESAVEYLIFKISDEPVRMNFIELDAIYAGCQMNVYSSVDDEPVKWTPYPQVYTLQSGRTELPMRKVKWIKLEFTMLCATPYDILMSKVPVVSRRFPWDVRDYCDKRFEENSGMQAQQQLLISEYDIVYDNGSPQNVIGAEELYEYKNILDNIDYEYSGIMLQRVSQYRSYQNSQIYSAYGENAALEAANISAPSTESFGTTTPHYRFNEVCEHVYDVHPFERQDNLAYVVGVRNVKFGFSARVFTARYDDTVYLWMQDGRFLDNVNMWEFENGERLIVSPEAEFEYGWKYIDGERVKVAHDSLASFETVDIQSIYPFRTFEFATNQRPAIEKFEHPSDMIQEWHGLSSDVASEEFGISGTVMRMMPSGVGSGVESDAKLTRSMAIASAQVDVYPLASGRWQFDCYDLFGEYVFSQNYQLEARKWNTVGANFVPMPGGNWWDRDYAYRVRLPLDGPLSIGQCVFVPVVDFDALQADGMIDDNFAKLRLVYFNGVQCVELPVDITDNMELWFRIQEEVRDGMSADASYDFDTNSFIGAYYLYFGPGYPQDEPFRDFHYVFDHAPYILRCDASWRELSEGDDDVEWIELYGSEIPSNSEELGFDRFNVGDNGTDFVWDNDMAIFDEQFRLMDKGFMSMEVSLFDALYRVPDGTLGTADVRFLLDYEDESKAVQLYFYERQLTFVIKERDGFESAFVSLREFDSSTLDPDMKMHILVEWNRRGTAPVHEVDETGESESVNPDNKNRRELRVYVDSATQLECIPNVYDEKHYYDTDKVY